MVVVVFVVVAVAVAVTVSIVVAVVVSVVVAAALSNFVVNSALVLPVSHVFLHFLLDFVSLSFGRLFPLFVHPCDLLLLKFNQLLIVVNPDLLRL